MSNPQPTSAGLAPHLPWPLSASPWWTRPVRAEPGALLRIGVALVVFLDLLLGYAPCLADLYGSGTTGSPELFRHRTEAPFWRWSLFHGVHVPLITGLALAALVVFSAWIVSRLAAPAEGRSTPGLGVVAAWLACGLVYVLGVWVRAAGDSPDSSVWWVPAALAVLAATFLVADRLRSGRLSPALVAALAVAVALAAIGVYLARPDAEAGRDVLRRAMTGWGEDFRIVRIAFVVWVAFAFLLLIGRRRVSAVVVWVLTVSFSNLSPEINSKGDAIRNLLLFYLMLCPCGAVWSVDRLWQRFRGESAGPVYVAPWPLRLLLLQLSLIYCFTGLFKALSPDWLKGEALHYVLGDLLLSRNSHVALPLPAWLLQAMTWFTLVWEISFPLWMLIPRTRTLALLSAVGFHLGTLMLMELGGFEFFMFAMILPLLPWTFWLGWKTPLPEPTAAAQPSRLLGAFVAWQAAFLVAGNVAGFLGDLPRTLPQSADRPLDATLPGWLDKGGRLRQPQETVLTVTDAWGQLTDQTQFWAMYRNAPRTPNLPAVSVRYPTADGSQRQQTLLWLSDYEPADMRLYFRFGELRVSRTEQAVTPFLPAMEHLDERERDEIWAETISRFVASEGGVIRNYLAVRLRQIQAKNPGLPAPTEVVLMIRQYRTNAPGEARGWRGPVVIPAARWLPESGEVEAYDPVMGRFVPVRAAE